MNYRRGIARLGIALQVTVAVFCGILIFMGGADNPGTLIVFFAASEVIIWAVLHAFIWIIDGFFK